MFLSSTSILSNLRRIFNHRPNISNMTTDGIEIGKKSAAYQAVDDFIKSDGIVGVGSGTTMPYVIERLATVCAENKWSIKFIPTSAKTKQLLLESGLPLTDLHSDPVIDVTIDGADEVDRNLVAIKGGGACVTQEKVVASVSKKFIVVADYRKDSVYLGDNWQKGIPIDVIPSSVNVVRRKISELFNVAIDDIEIRVNPDNGKPVLTDDGNNVLDWKFEYEEEDKSAVDHWSERDNQIKLLTGVVSVGIFANIVDAAYFGQRDGSVKKVLAEKNPKSIKKCDF